MRRLAASRTRVRRAPRPTTNRAGRRRYLSPFTTVPALVAWLALCLALYWAQRLVADLGHWKMNEKTAAVHKEDLLRQTLLSGLLFLRDYFRHPELEAAGRHRALV